MGIVAPIAGAMFATACVFAILAIVFGFATTSRPGPKWPAARLGFAALAVASILIIVAIWLHTFGI